MMIVMTTVDSAERASALARGLVERRLAACVQVLPPMTSVYHWEGAVRAEAEHLLLIKTAGEKYGEVEAYILANHNYDVPEIVAVNAERVSQGYAGWLEDYLFARR